MDSQYHPHKPDDSLLEAFRYINQIPGKDIRGRLIDAFQKWIIIPKEKADIVKDIIAQLHNASLLVDDIEDGSKLRRGIPVAHDVFGVPTTINTANYVYFLALERCHMLGSPRAMNVFVLELLNLHRGQGQDILWRDQLRCPTEEQYRAMVLDKTGGLFRLAVGLMQAVQDDSSAGENGAESSSSSSRAEDSATVEQRAESEGSSVVVGGGIARDYTPLVNKLALYFQIRDDLVNLSSSEYMSSKSYCEDLSEGKFSFPILHAIHSQPNDQQLLSILKQRTESVDIKRYAVEYMDRCGSFDYTRAVLEELKTEVMAEVALLGGHSDLIQLLNSLHAQVSDTPTTTSGVSTATNRCTSTGNQAQSSQGSSGAADYTSGGAGRGATGEGGGKSLHSAHGSASGSSGSAAATAPPSSFPRVDSI